MKILRVGKANLRRPVELKKRDKPYLGSVVECKNCDCRFQLTKTTDRVFNVWSWQCPFKEGVKKTERALDERHDHECLKVRCPECQEWVDCRGINNELQQ